MSLEGFDEAGLEDASDAQLLRPLLQCWTLTIHPYSNIPSFYGGVRDARPAYPPRALLCSSAGVGN